jgi:uroporphyrinogen decarboxylase
MRIKDELSRRERVLLAMAHRTTDRIPISDICGTLNPPAGEAFNNYLVRYHNTDAISYIVDAVDTRSITYFYNGPGLDAGEDPWGVRKKPVSYGAGSYDEICYYPLKDIQTVGELDRHRWPSADWFQYDIIKDMIKGLNGDEEYCIIAASAAPFETSWAMRGFEQTFMDMVTKPDLVHGIMQRVTDFYLESFRRLLKATDGMIDLVYTSDDIGGQTGLLVSLPMWEEFIKPYHVRFNEMVHNMGAKIIYHSDGAIMSALEGLIDMGIDILQPLQFDAKGMDPAALKKQTGARLCYEGGVSVQKLLPFGTVEEVVSGTKNLIDILGKDGGYILGPSHNIQAGTPPENIYAMFQTARSYYPHR